jgi:hypothetical protein
MERVYVRRDYGTFAISQFGKVANEPEVMTGGRDQQIEAAVMELMKGK